MSSLDTEIVIPVLSIPGFIRGLTRRRKNQRPREVEGSKSQGLKVKGSEFLVPSSEPDSRFQIPYSKFISDLKHEDSSF